MPYDNEQSLLAAIREVSDEHINKLDDEGLSLLHHAAGIGSLEATRLLIQRGANIKVEDRYGYHPFHYAREGDHILIVRELTEQSLLKDVLECPDEDINKLDGEGLSLLHHAAWLGSIEATRLVIGRRADVDIKTRDHGNTALHYAATEGRDSIVACLLEAGAEVSVRNKKGQTPVLLAALSMVSEATNYQGKFSTMKLLIGTNKAIDYPDEEGRTFFSTMMDHNVRLGNDMDELLSRIEKDRKKATAPEQSTAATAVPTTDASSSALDPMLSDSAPPRVLGESAHRGAADVDSPDRNIKPSSSTIPDADRGKVKNIGQDAHPCRV